MTVGALFIALAVALWVLIGLQVHLIPGVDAFAHALFGLGILLGGWSWAPWYRSVP